MKYQVFLDGAWQDVDVPRNGQRYRINHASGGFLEAIWCNDPMPVVEVANVKFAGADLLGNIYCITEGTDGIITADMIAPTPELVISSGQMRVIVEKKVLGQTVDEYPFTATLTAANGETPARLSLPVRLPKGFYAIDPKRLNIGLSNPKINAPYRLHFDAIDIDCVGGV